MLLLAVHVEVGAVHVFDDPAGELHDFALEDHFVRGERFVGYVAHAVLLDL